MIENAFPLDTVIRWAADITGKGQHSDRDLLLDLIKESLEALYLEESVENLRKWCIPSCGCSITAPKELANPVMYKVGDKVSPVRTKAYEFLGYTRKDAEGYYGDLQYQGEYPTYFDMPSGGAQVCARALEQLPQLKESDPQPHLVVQGLNASGNPVYSRRKNGEMDIGEIVPIVGPDCPPPSSYNKFKEITSVRIVNSNHNIHFMWANIPSGAVTASSIGLLAYYDPGDEYPAFRRYKIPSLANSKYCYNIEVLGHLKMPSLRYDNELVRGFNSNTIRSMIRANYYRSKNDIQGATFNSGLAMTSIRKNNEKRHKNSDEVAVNQATSAGKFPTVY